MKQPLHLVSSLALVGLLSTLNAEALTLGRLKVLSALGQPLVAEIEVPEITPEEASSLRVGIASADAFKSAGLEYNPTVSTLNIAGKRRADGRALLELRSVAPIADPFLDLVLEITWATGRIVRDYTLLLDPPTGTSTPAIVPVPTLPIQSVAPSIRVVTAPATATSLSDSSQAATPVSVAPLGSSTRFSVRTGSKPTASTKNKVTVKRGDTAAAIASANKSEGVSLDQMLVAMLRDNPEAFVAGNVNRLKSGALLAVPSAEEASNIAKGAAKDSIQIQTRDFNDYRRKLAGLAPSTALDTPARLVTGKVVAKLDDKKPSIDAPDRLTLSKPNSSKADSAAPEDKIAKEKTSLDASARSAELQKNIADLGKITSVTSINSTVAAPTVAASSPQAALSTPLPPLDTASLAPALVVSTPTSVVSQAMTIKKHGSFLDQIIMHPWAMPVGGGLLALLGLGTLWGVRRRRASNNEVAPQNSMSFPVTRPTSDTVFGALGANRVDTSQESSASSTMVYSPSQLGSANGDVDPIAEADVYLAYNRDVQAEEILREARATSPERTDVQVKLMEIYVKRRDNEAFDAAALELHRQTDGAGVDWARARELAREIASKHSLFNASAPSFAAFEASKEAFIEAPHRTPAATLSEAVTSSPDLPSHTGLIDFDLSALTLDLPKNDNPGPTVSSSDPKLALAEEYLSIGDKAGARALIQDVITHGAPTSLAAAQLMLSRIG